MGERKYFLVAIGDKENIQELFLFQCFVKHVGVEIHFSRDAKNNMKVIKFLT